MIAIDEAIKTRWNSRSVGNAVTGGIHQSIVPQVTYTMPYAKIEQVDDKKVVATRQSEYRQKVYDITVYHRTPDLAEAAAAFAVGAFRNAHLAAVNPLSIGASGKIINCQIDEPTTPQAGDEVFESKMRLVVDYAINRNIAPAS